MGRCRNGEYQEKNTSPGWSPRQLAQCVFVGNSRATCSEQQINAHISYLSPLFSLSCLDSKVIGGAGCYSWRKKREREREQIKEKAFIYSAMMLVKDAVSHRMLPSASVWQGAGRSSGWWPVLWSWSGFWAGPTSTPSTLFPVWAQRDESRLEQVTEKESGGEGQSRVCDCGGVCNCLRYVERSCVGFFWGLLSFSSPQWTKRSPTSRIKHPTAAV